jgi:alpha-ketoglutarate-dependent taurine dioxygenase
MGVLTIERLDATLGARITGVRLADLDDGTWEAIAAAFDDHAVLVFPGQGLSGEEQKAFGRRFGPLEDISGTKGLTPITNARPDGTLRRPDDQVMGILRGNEGWHTDSSYMPVSAKASMLSAHVVPSDGGGTEWADMRAAYDALPDATKARIQDLAAHHSLFYSQEKIGVTNHPKGAYGYHDGPAPLRPLVKVHPATGRPALYIGRHAYGVPGLTEAESEALLDELLTFACQPPRVYHHDWEVGDLVVWDNRCVLHRARPWNLDQLRVMKHTRVSGDPATEGVAA